MSYFYYVRNFGKLYPRKSIDHPMNALQKPRNIVGEVKKLPPQLESFSLSSLSQIYPPAGDEK